MKSTIYNGGGVSDARTLRGLARSIVVRELQEIVMQLLELGPDRVDELKEIAITIDTQETAKWADCSPAVTECRLRY